MSGTTIGLDGVLIEVEVDVSSHGFPAFNIVGLPSKSIDEAKERVRAAIINTDYHMPDTRITINLAPADIPKEGSGFDLPIAVGILAASGMIDKNSLKDSLFFGELSLQGEVRKVSGVISLAILAKKKKIKKLFIPAENAPEGSLVDGLEVYPISNIIDLILHLNSHKLIVTYPNIQTEKLMEDNQYEYLFEDIKGQETAKRALLIAASGFHNLILKGPPGTGKTMLSRAFSSILPPLDREEILEITKIYSVVGLLKNFDYITKRPFRCPHHTTSRIGLIGGGSNPTPGEISLAHRGVLFLDELPEFPRSTLESLRQPLEDGEVTISRAQGTLTFPSRFLLLGALNPCPCGFLGHPKKSCHCLPGSILRYKKRLSGPLLDRIDLHVDVPPVDEEKLTSVILLETSEKIRGKVVEARVRQKQRFKNSRLLTNGEMRSSDIKKHCILTDRATDLLKQAISRLSLSARGYFKTIKVAQTIADCEKQDKIDISHIAEALQYRSHDEVL